MPSLETKSHLTIEPIPGPAGDRGELRVTYVGDQKVMTGLWRIHWASGGTSMASIGMTYSGQWWIAPSNWQYAAELPIHRSYGSDRTTWHDIVKLESIDPEELQSVAVPVKQRMHIVTVEFSIVLDEVPMMDEVRNLTSGIQEAYDQLDMPDGSFRVVSIGPEEDHSELDPCFSSEGYYKEFQHHPMTPMQALQSIRDNVWRLGQDDVAMSNADFEQFVIPFTHAP
jgi:hypothetical protein